MISATNTNNDSQSQKHLNMLMRLGQSLIHVQSFMELVLEHTTIETSKEVELETSIQASGKKKIVEYVSVRLQSEIMDYISSALSIENERRMHDKSGQVLNKKMDQLLQHKFILVLPLLVLYIFAADKSTLCIFNVYIVLRILDFFRYSLALMRLGGQAEDLFEAEFHGGETHFSAKGCIVHGNSILDWIAIILIIVRML